MSGDSCPVCAPASRDFDPRVLRRLLAGANLLRVAALISASVATAFGVLSLAQLAVILAVIGLCSVLSNISESGLFATTLPAELYVAGQAASYTGQTAAILAGPGIGGLLVQLAGVPAAVGESVQDISVGSVFALVVPPHLRSQTRGAYQTVSFGLRPLGAVAGAVIAATAGIPVALWAGAIGGILACGWLLPARLLSFRGQGDAPEHPEIAAALAQ